MHFIGTAMATVIFGYFLSFRRYLISIYSNLLLSFRFDVVVFIFCCSLSLNVYMNPISARMYACMHIHRNPTHLVFRFMYIVIVFYFYYSVSNLLNFILINRMANSSKPERERAGVKRKFVVCDFVFAIVRWNVSVVAIAIVVWLWLCQEKEYKIMCI